MRASATGVSRNPHRRWETAFEQHVLSDASANIVGVLDGQLHECPDRAAAILLVHLVDIELCLSSASVPKREIVRVWVRAPGRALPPDRRVLVPVEQPVGLIAHPIGIEQVLAHRRHVELHLAWRRGRLRYTGSGHGNDGLRYGCSNRGRRRRYARCGLRFRLTRSGRGEAYP